MPNYVDLELLQLKLRIVFAIWSYHNMNLKTSLVVKFHCSVVLAIEFHIKAEELTCLQPYTLLRFVVKSS